MRITDVRTWLVAVTPQINWVFLRIDTDAGVHGWGEATLEGRDEAVIGAVAGLARDLIGEPVPAPEMAWRRALRSAPWRGADLYTAMSAFDHALWDIRGKVLDQPVHVLLGGPVRDRLHVYTWAGRSEEHATLTESVQHAQDEWGFTHFKIAPLREWFTLSQDGLAGALAEVDETVEALPPNGKLGIEAHQRLHASAAVEFARALEGRPIMFIEDFVTSYDISSLRRLRDQTSLPIIAGEKQYSRWEVWPWLAEGLVDYLSVDLCHAGGISETLRIASTAEAAGVPLIPHNPNGPVGFAATLQAAAAHPNIIATETVFQRFALMKELTGASPEIVDGYAAVPSGPGLGVDLDIAALERHRGTPRTFPIEGEYTVPQGRI